MPNTAEINSQRTLYYQQKSAHPLTQPRASQAQRFDAKETEASNSTLYKEATDMLASATDPTISLPRTCAGEPDTEEEEEQDESKSERAISTSPCNGTPTSLLFSITPTEPASPDQSEANSRAASPAIFPDSLLELTTPTAPDLPLQVEAPNPFDKPWEDEKKSTNPFDDPELVLDRKVPENTSNPFDLFNDVAEETLLFGAPLPAAPTATTCFDAQATASVFSHTPSEQIATLA